MRRLGGTLLVTAAIVAGGAASLRAQATDSLVASEAASLLAQATDSLDSVDSPDSVDAVDSLDSVVPIIRDSTGVVITGPTHSVQMAGSAVDESQWPDPTVTLFKSMLVPGWGQITNKAYIKAALAIGLEAWFISGAVVNWNYMNQALDNYRADPNNLDHYYDYQYYHGMRSDFLWALGVTVFVSMFDAYVDAHLRPYSGDTIPGVDPPKGLVLVIPL